MTRLITLLFIFLFSCAVLPLLQFFFVQNGIFPVKIIAVSPKNSHVSKQEIETFLTPYLGKSLYAFHLDEVKEKLKMHPWIKTIAVRRFPPNELHVSFQEHIPYALVSLPKLYLIDEEGQLFKILQEQEKNRFQLPLITGPTKPDFSQNQILFKQQIQSAIVALKEHKKANFPGGKIVQLHISPVLRITVYFDNGLEVVLGKDNYPKKWSKLFAIISAFQEKKADLEYAYLDDYPHTYQVAIRLKKA